MDAARPRAPDDGRRPGRLRGARRLTAVRRGPAARATGGSARLSVRHGSQPQRRLRAPLVLAGDDARAAGSVRPAAARYRRRRRHRRRLRGHQRRPRAGAPRASRSPSLEAQTLGWGASTRNGGIVHAGYKWAPRAARQAVRRGDRQGAVPGDARRRTRPSSGSSPTRRSTATSARSATSSSRMRLATSRSWSTPARAWRSSASTARRSCPRERIREEIGSDAYYGALAVDRAAGCSTRAATSPAWPPPRTAPAPTSTRASVRGRSGARPTGGSSSRPTAARSSPATSSSPRTATRTGSLPSLRRRIIPIGSYIIASEPLPEELARELSPEGPLVLRHEELPVLLARVGGPPDDVRRPGDHHADVDRPDGGDPPQGPARGPPAARRRTGSSTRGAATSGSPSTGCRTSAGRRMASMYASAAAGRASRS